MASPRPIGVFDSGIGGLTVVHELIRQLPHESIVYFGDTARVPYGPKSPDTVRRYSREIASFLTDQDVKAIVIACNTATAHALGTLRAELSLPVVGVVEPGARAAMRTTTSNVVGVIGTAGTIASGAYERAIHAIEPTARVVARACPLFVPLVEEGWTDREATRLIAREYLEPLAAAQVDTIVLGCTHYPLLARTIADVMGPNVTLVSSAEETAFEVRHQLAGTPAAPLPCARVQFVTSGDVETFRRLGTRFCGPEVDAVEAWSWS